MKSHTAVPAFLAVACTMALAGCVPASPAAVSSPPTSASATPPTPQRETPSPVATDWQEGDLTMATGADLPAGLDTVVVNSYAGADAWERSPGSDPSLSTYVHAATQCFATHGVLALPGRSDVGDLAATADFLGAVQGSDISDIEPIIMTMPYTAGIAAPIAETSDLHKIEMAAYPAAGEDTATIWAARALERVGKGFIFALTCPDVDQLGDIFEEAKSLVTFGVYDPVTYGLP
ncbi:hypothetical protein [Microbacterium arborescens]|uniref:hypothetical protein n=1 Tax=Microbacterium arborescens TaxID=33883 RepID=UPI00277FEDBE|nr:hypothetical protein [Microbacterium arborescens]MDQ1216467.1 hypothetical protein [Microbacterium arborescens]